MNDELASMHANRTWNLTEVTPDTRILPVRWIFKIKRGSDGSIQRFKARLVAKGFRQREGVDYGEVYAPVSKHATLRALLSHCAVEDLELDQLDVKTAFLNGDLDEEIYMQQPPGFERGGPMIACRLLKAIYGLKQAPRVWHLKLKAELESLGFKVSSADPSLYVLTCSAGVVYLLVYVDDILGASASKALLAKVKKEISEKFDVRDLGGAGTFLGMEITRDRTARTIMLTQSKLTLDLLSQHNMLHAKPRSTPLETGSHLPPGDASTDLHHAKQVPYAELIGSL